MILVIKLDLSELATAVRRSIQRRVPSWQAVTLSTKKSFEGGYEELKKEVKKVLDALYSICKAKRYVYKLWYKVVVYNGHPHVHGVMMADCKAVQRELARLWSKAGLGYGEFVSKRKRGNCCFKPVTDITGWLKYIHSHRNSYGTRLKYRTSRNGGSEFKKMSVHDVDRMYRCDLSTLKNLMYADMARV